MLQDKVACDFVGPYLQVNALLNFDKPVTHGVQTEQDWHFEHKAKQHAALMGSKKVILETFAQFKELTGREYKLVESYGMEDAEIAIVCLGSTFETAMLAIDQLREEGIKAGVVAPRLFRPFPLEEVADALQNVKAVACMDRSAPGGTVGALYNEVSGALINTAARPLVSNLIYGLGGRDMTVAGLKNIFKTLDKEAKDGKLAGKIQRFVGVRGPELSFYEAKGAQK